MKFYEIIIKPESSFGTPLKGDTLFGHFCWQAVYDQDLLDGGLEVQLEKYEEKPCVVFSSAFPAIETMDGNRRYFLPRPEAIVLDRRLTPAKSRKARLLEGKALKEKKWMELNRLDVIDPSTLEFLTDDEVALRIKASLRYDELNCPIKAEVTNFLTAFAQPHNSINRLTGTTGSGSSFAPYETESLYYLSGITLAVFTLFDEACTDIEKICAALRRIGRWGFGKDASTGKGKFSIHSHTEIPLPRIDGANACFTLAPAVPRPGSFKRSFFTPFVRFGKHGDQLATGKAPFKRPVIMADEGAVFFPAERDISVEPWIGTGIRGVSYAESKTVVQGYAPWLPFKMEL